MKENREESTCKSIENENREKRRDENREEHRKEHINYISYIQNVYIMSTISLKISNTRTPHIDSTRSRPRPLLLARCRLRGSRNARRLVKNWSGRLAGDPGMGILSTWLWLQNGDDPEKPQILIDFTEKSLD